MTSDAEKILRQLAGGEGHALGELYDRYANTVKGLAMRILRDRCDAEEVVQDVFVQVWSQAGRFDPLRGTPLAWLCAIARTRAIDRLRRRVARREQGGDPHAAIMGISERPRSENGIAVRKALDGIPPDQRRALELAYYDGLTHSEIARRVGAPLGTIKTRIRTGLTRLRGALGSFS
ncbi:MAG TPA: sigma-70 family RNA polymerase sigma factor [Vicinamibacteria bacterium]|nr:sigma-70 family RNA polymerase sigma factor [Vicinamibacteria bacterium]